MLSAIRAAVVALSSAGLRLESTTATSTSVRFKGRSVSISQLFETKRHWDLQCFFEKLFVLQTVCVLKVEFAHHQTVATITVFIRDDSLPEVDETTLITLNRIVESGTDLPGRGAVVGRMHHISLQKGIEL